MPGHSVMGTVAKWLGNSKFEVALREENSCYPDLATTSSDILSRVKFFYINYPNNSIGQIAIGEFF